MVIKLDALRQIDFVAACGAALLAVLLVAFPDFVLLAAIATFGVKPNALMVFAGAAGLRWYVSQGGKLPGGPAGLADVLEPKTVPA